VATSPKTVNLLRRTIAAMADIASASAGRALVIGDGPSRITAELRKLEIEPSEVLEVLDPTAVDADLAETLRVPGSLSDLVAPWREGARAAVRATGKVTQAMLAAGLGRYELAAGVRIEVADVRGPDWSAERMTVTTGPVQFTSGLEPSLQCVGVDVNATLGSSDLAKRAEQLSVTSVSVENGLVMIRPSGGFASLVFGVLPRFHAGRVALETRAVGWRGRTVRVPTIVSRRWTRWIDPPAWLEIDDLHVDGGAVEVRGRVDEWAQAISVETMQRLAEAAQRRGQDLVLPRRSAPSG
jgi:hypothetical protein